jgi:Ras-related protein Rab-18
MVRKGQSLLDNNSILLSHIFSYIHLYEGMKLIPFVSRAWNTIFDQFAGKQIPDYKHIVSKELLILHEIWSKSDSLTIEQFVKLLLDRIKSCKVVGTPICKKVSLRAWIAGLLCGISRMPSDTILDLSGADSIGVDIVPVRVLFLGDSKVGKTSLYLSMVTKQPSKKSVDYRRSLGNFHTREFNVRGRQYSVLLYDEHVRSNIEVVLLCFDISNAQSFVNVQERWAPKTMDLQRILVGLQTDKRKERTVSRRAAEEFAESMGSIYIEASAYDYTNVNQLYNFILFSQVYKEYTGNFIGKNAPDRMRYRESYFNDDDDVNEL